MSSNLARYKKDTKTSARMFARSRRLHVNGVSHNIRYFEPYPFVVESAGQKSLTDVDGNRYTDYWMGHWSLILGHGPGPVKCAIKRQVEKGWMYGTVNKQTILLSDAISRAVKVAEKIRYVTSGTEATMYAVRLARSATGRRVIAKIDGGWHGYTSDLLKSVNWPFSEPESSGITGESIISLPYNDLEESLHILERNAADLAGVIIEPVLGGGGCIPATQEYLCGIQEFARKNGSVFMLDEIVTGFRFRYGCLYPALKLDPDLVTLGKIVGGGMAIGVICGKKEIMDAADAAQAKSRRSYIGGGTFSANPASMTAGLATLKRLKSGSIHSQINKLGEHARRELARAFDGRVAVTGRGSLFMTHFLKDGTSQVTSASHAAMCDVGMLAKYHFKMIAADKIFFLPGKLGAISACHTRRDIARMAEASSEFAMQNFV